MLTPFIAHEPHILVLDFLRKYSKWFQYRHAIMLPSSSLKPESTI
jgi:hypothetical protein